MDDSRRTDTDRALHHDGRDRDRLSDRARVRAQDGSRVAATEVPHEIMGRLERMEQAIDAIAVEVERISEGQRFTTKLLSERQQSQALPPRQP